MGQEMCGLAGADQAAGHSQPLGTQLPMPWDQPLWRSHQSPSQASSLSKENQNLRGILFRCMGLSGIEAPRARVEMKQLSCRETVRPWCNSCVFEV